MDPSVLALLRRELEPDAAFCTVFVDSYIQQLPRRVGRLRYALDTMDFEVAMDAVLSIKTSSQMVGAAHLSYLADQLESVLRLFGSDPDTGTGALVRTGLLERMDACIGQTVAGLSSAAA
ncbi:Hpt domain-containing protein [Arthrobacter sp. 92]|uniref:Hpt domain-containing protein n=1 Tax=Arthrobacter sp. 92 TaxID=3418175 RepID=UPI003CFE9ED6